VGVKLNRAASKIEQRNEKKMDIRAYSKSSVIPLKINFD
jgi:hypothetical protein